MQVHVFLVNSCLLISYHHLTAVDTRDGTPKNDKGIRLVMMERRGGSRPKDPYRDTLVKELRTQGDEVIPAQSRSYETIHPSRVTEPAAITPVPIRSYAQDVREELRRLREVEVARSYSKW